MFVCCLDTHLWGECLASPPTGSSSSSSKIKCNVHTALSYPSTKARNLCMSVCISVFHIARIPLIRLTSNLAGVLLMSLDVHVGFWCSLDARVIRY